jgi:hypothetical protein
MSGMSMIASKAFAALADCSAASASFFSRGSPAHSASGRVPMTMIVAIATTPTRMLCRSDVISDLVSGSPEAVISV